MFQPTISGLRSWLNALAGTGQPLDPAATWMGLYQVGSVPTPNSTLADFTEATYDGYSRRPLAAWSQAFLSAGKATIQDGTMLFRPTGGTTSNTIAGYFLIDSASGSGNVKAYEGLASPKVLNSTLDVLYIEPRLTLDELANYGAAGVQR